MATPTNPTHSTQPNPDWRHARMEDVPTEVVAALDRGEDVFSTRELQEHFNVIGFLAPYVVVTRRADGVKGSLTFTHSPRWYFGWEPHEEDT